MYPSKFPQSHFSKDDHNTAHLRGVDRAVDQYQSLNNYLAECAEFGLSELTFWPALCFWGEKASTNWDFREHFQLFSNVAFQTWKAQFSDWKKRQSCIIIMAVFYMVMYYHLDIFMDLWCNFKLLSCLTLTVVCDFISAYKQDSSQEGVDIITFTDWSHGFMPE